MKQITLNIADSKFNTFLEFIKTLEYVKVENDEEKALDLSKASISIITHLHSQVSNLLNT